MPVTVDEFVVADTADAWTAAGFTVDLDDICRIGGVRIRLAGRERGTGIVGWALRGVPSDQPLDGISTARTDAPPSAPAGATAFNNSFSKGGKSSVDPSSLRNAQSVCANCDARGSSSITR